MIVAMKAAILAIGSELLGTERLDTNSLKLTAVLERYGVSLVTKRVLGDDEEAIAQDIRSLSDSVDLIMITGGLGPTRDDRTRSAVARAFDLGLSTDEALVEHIRALFASFGRVMPEVNRRQAEVIDGAEVLSNPKGTAPGQLVSHGDCSVFLFPGVPRELKAMIERHLDPWLVHKTSDGSDDPVMVEHHTVKLACRAESEVEETLAPIYEKYGHDAVAVLASPGDIKIQVTARGTRDQRRAAMEPLVADLEELLGVSVYHSAIGEGLTSEARLEAVVGSVLEHAGLTMVTAESCTGGLVAERMTRVPGSSGWFLGGAVTYTNELKHQMLDVPMELFESHGAVSEPVARAMAEGARRNLGADIAVSMTGIAGPGGGSEHKPVGMVHLAVAGPGDSVQHRRVIFPGDRERIRLMTSQLALEMVRRQIVAPKPSPSAETSTLKSSTLKEAAE